MISLLQKINTFAVGEIYAVGGYAYEIITVRNGVAEDIMYIATRKNRVWKRVEETQMIRAMWHDKLCKTLTRINKAEIHD